MKGGISNFEDSYNVTNCRYKTENFITFYVDKRTMPSVSKSTILKRLSVIRGFGWGEMWKKNEKGCELTMVSYYRVYY